MDFIDDYNSVEDYLDGPINDMEDFLDTNKLIVTNQNKLEELDKLPTRESRKQYITRVFRNMYDIDRFDHPWYYTNIFEKIAKRIINNNIGKSYDLAFSYYCKKVPKHKQYLFEEFFEQKTYKYRYGTYYGYYIDENGLIQESELPTS